MLSKNMYRKIFLGFMLMATSAFCSRDILAASKATSSAARAPAGTPLRSIQDLDDMISQFKTEKHLSPADEAFNKALKHKIIHGTFDIEELTRLALGQHWKERTGAEQQHFVDLMISLIEERALLSKEQSAAKSRHGGEYRVVYKSEKYLDDAKTRALVRTTVIVPSEDITIGLNYRVKKVKTEWKIYDVIVDDSSLMENYRFQFHDIILKHGYGELVGRVERKLEEFRTKRDDHT